MLNAAQAAHVAETLRVSLWHAATNSDDRDWARSMASAEKHLPTTEPSDHPPHPALPSLGASILRTLPVTEADTAVAMGHPDRSLNLLGSPQIALWFEMVASELLPTPTPHLTHVGSGICVHHLAPAEVGEQVTVEASTLAAAGRRVVFACSATVGPRCVALGVHQRVALDDAT